MPQRPQVTIRTTLRAAAGGATLVLSLSALTGWVVRSPALVQARGDWVPMQPNTAIGLLLLSVALLLAIRGRRRTAAACGIAAAALGAATVAQDAFRVDLGIDHALIDPWLATHAPRPARMAPNTALGLVLLGLAKAIPRSLRLVATLFSVIAWALGAEALIGYVAGIQTAYAWGSMTPMAPATAASLLVLSSAILADRLLWMEGPVLGLGLRTRWRGPLLAGLGGTALTLLLFRALVAHHEHQAEVTVAATAQRTRTEIRVALREQRDALVGLAREWDDRLFRRRSAWESDARITLARSRGMSAIGWFDAGGSLDWSYPPDTVSPRIDLSHPDEAADAAHGWLRPVEMADGASGFALAVAVEEPGSGGGWLCGLFRSDAFFGQLSPLLPEGFSFRIHLGEAMLFESGPLAAAASPWARRLALETGSNAGVTVYPTRAWLAVERSPLPRLLLAAGLVMSGLLVWALRAAQLSTAHAAALEREVRAHERAANEVRTLNRELEERVSRRTEDLERSNEALQGFASFLSHELRQPLSVLSMRAALLAADGAEAGEAQEHVDAIRRSVQRMGELIDSQLSLAVATSHPAAPALVEPVAVFDQVTTELGTRLRELGAKVLRESLPPVPCDARQLYPLFRNLVENSIKYRRPDVPLVLRVSGRTSESAVEILYEDNGRGFSPGDADRIFAPFERADAGEAQGHGLGLALCRRIMERAGGHIVAEGRPGEGATFRMEFPTPSSGPRA